MSIIPQTCLFLQLTCPIQDLNKAFSLHLIMMRHCLIFTYRGVWFMSKMGKWWSAKEMYFCYVFLSVPCKHLIALGLELDICMIEPHSSFIHSFIHSVFIECLLNVRHCSRHRGSTIKMTTTWSLCSLGWSLCRC